jgi:hypothetical protein
MILATLHSVYVWRVLQGGVECVYDSGHPSLPVGCTVCTYEASHRGGSIL